MIYPENFEIKIGFDAIRKRIESLCTSTLGVEKCREMGFSTDYCTVLQELNETNEFLQILVSKKEFPSSDFFDVTASLNSIRIEGAYMSVEELYKVMRSLVVMDVITAFFRRKDDDSALQYPTLYALCENMHSFPMIIHEIDSILDKYGNMKDNASPTLLSLKKSINSVTSSINGTLRRIISQGQQNGVLGKDINPSVRDGRIVIPVAPMNKRKIQGIVHDESATGKTVFIEPSEIVEANNMIRELEGDIRREILRILQNVASVIRPFIDDLLESYDIMGQFDFIRAKARFAEEINACLPHIEKSIQLEWYHAFHPILYLSLCEQGKKIVPLDIKLDNENRILVISGPNAGGKSVCLKTVGMVQYMVQCGLLPPVYSNSHIGIFQSLIIDIGDEQSIENDLSTYSSHLTNMKVALINGNAQTLILIDEFGSGTEPQIGGSIAQAILHRFNDKKMYGVITTHYQNLKLFADNTQGIINGAMLYDRSKMEPLFQLSIGYPGSSFAIEIARKIGLPQDVINDAQKIVGSDYVNMDKYLLDISRDKKYWENKRQDIRIKQKKIDEIAEKYNSQLEKVKSEQNEIIKAAKGEAKNILMHSNAIVERTILEIKKAQAQKEETKQIRKQLEDFKAKLFAEGEPPALQNLKPIRVPKEHSKRKPAAVLHKAVTASAPLNVGDYAKLDDKMGGGKILSIDGKWAMVAFGNLKTRVELSRLERVSASSVKKQDISFVGNDTTNEIRSRQLDFKPEIDVRGMRADEALQAVTYFIDDAIQFNISRVRILHGTGTGILRIRIREYLDTIQGVKSYRDEHVQYGGAGITVVEIE